jgi:chromosome segregation ATPase
MHHLKQLSQQHSRRVDMPVDEPQQSGNTSSQHFIKELESLKEESKFDAEIVASQEKRIKELEIKLDASSNETNSYRQEIKKLKEAFTIIQEKSQKNDENLFHLRKVTNILQMEITAKDQDLKHLRERLQIALSEKEKLEMNSREENVNVSDLKKGFTRQNEELLSFISSLSLHLSQSIPVASKGNETKEDDHQEQSPSSVKVKIPITNNIETLRLQMERIEKCVFSMTNQVKQPEKENSSLFDENDSLCNQLKDMKEEKGKCQENVNHAQSMTIFSHAEIKQRQVHLQEELNEIYKQIQASIPPSYGKGGKSDSRPEIDTSLQLNRRDELLEEVSRSKIDTSQRPERRDELLEEFRPWRKHAQTEKR